jgi:hypothetical protein
MRAKIFITSQTNLQVYKAYKKSEQHKRNKGTLFS